VFYQQVIERPVPVDMPAIRQLKRSPLALDIYVWATWRVSYLKQPSMIRWETLRWSLGAGYANTPKGRSQFRSKMLSALRKVIQVYPDLRAVALEEGLLLKPSKTHVSRRSDSMIVHR
jgi:hypothetical protein